jgi:hypothetical protein
MAQGDLILGRYRRVRELIEGGTFVRVWLVECVVDARIRNGVIVKCGQQLVAKIFSASTLGVGEIDEPLRIATKMQDIIHPYVV